MNLATAPTSRPTWVDRHVRVTQTVATASPLGLAGSGDAADLGAAAQLRQLYYIKGELPRGSWLHYAVPVHVSIEGAEFVAAQPQLGIHALGESAVDAILSLREELVEHYARLEELGDKVSPRLARQRALLRRLLTGGDA